jgi:hypothetical protein
MCGWLAAGFVVPWLCADRNTLRCTFLAVDHGCAVALELPSGATVLYDAGQFSSPEVGTQAISAYLWSRGKMYVDAIVLSHPDADHYNAVPGLLERFRVGQITLQPDGQRINKVPAVLYNRMIHPLLRFPTQGVIWYQGESNANNDAQAIAYRPLFAGLINGWRREWARASGVDALRELPFLWVQLPNFGAVDTVRPTAGWACCASRKRPPCRCPTRPRRWRSTSAIRRTFTRATSSRSAIGSHWQRCGSPMASPWSRAVRSTTTTA